MGKIKIAVLFVMALMLNACANTAEEHRAAVSNQDKDRLTVGTAQREIHKGMTSEQVAEVLGSPNMVTTDESRRESWIYDKISTEKVYSTSSGGLGLIFGGAGGIDGGGLLGGIGGSQRNGSGAVSTTQRTLTIIVKFDNRQRVRDYAYRSSSF